MPMQGGPGATSHNYTAERERETKNSQAQARFLPDPRSFILPFTRSTTGGYDGVTNCEVTDIFRRDSNPGVKEVTDIFRRQ